MIPASMLMPEGPAHGLERRLLGFQGAAGWARQPAALCVGGRTQSQPIAKEAEVVRMSTAGEGRGDHESKQVTGMG